MFKCSSEVFSNQMLLTDVHVREPEGDVLIFMTGQVILFIFRLRNGIYSISTTLQ